MQKFILSSALSLSMVASAAAETSSRDFLEANILGIFYHELGHALVDIEGVPIFGQEEDAADTLSIYLIDSLFDNESATALAYDAALGFWAEAEEREDSGEEISWWDLHGPDEQRFFNTVCLFFGADPDTRSDFAEDLGLPEERADSCPEEFEQAHHSWGEILGELTERGPGDTLKFSTRHNSIAAKVLREEVAALNGQMSLSQPLSIEIESCGEANAYYDPAETKIVFCSEFEDHLKNLQRLVVDPD